MGTEGQAPHAARGMEAINQASRDGRLNFTRPLAARAAAPDELRAAVEGLAAEYESDRDVCLSWIEDPRKHVDPYHPLRLSDRADLLNRSAEQLRDILAAHPAPGELSADLRGQVAAAAEQQQLAGHDRGGRMSEDEQSRIVTRPWCCPEPRCRPIHQLRGDETERLDVPTPGDSFVCFGIAPPVEFTYDGVEHANDTRSCAYTPLKGLIAMQETDDDWRLLSRAYGRAAYLADTARARAARDTIEEDA